MLILPLSAEFLGLELLIAFPKPLKIMIQVTSISTPGWLTWLLSLHIQLYALEKPHKVSILIPVAAVLNFHLIRHLIIQLNLLLRPVQGQSLRRAPCAWLLEGIELVVKFCILLCFFVGIDSLIQSVFNFTDIYGLLLSCIVQTASEHSTWLVEAGTIVSVTSSWALSTLSWAWSIAKSHGFGISVLRIYFQWVPGWSLGSHCWLFGRCLFFLSSAYFVRRAWKVRFRLQCCHIDENPIAWLNTTSFGLVHSGGFFQAVKSLACAGSGASAVGLYQVWSLWLSKAAAYRCSCLPTLASRTRPFLSFPRARRWRLHMNQGYWIGVLRWLLCAFVAIWLFLRLFRFWVFIWCRRLLYLLLYFALAPRLRWFRSRLAPAHWAQFVQVRSARQFLHLARVEIMNLFGHVHVVHVIFSIFLCLTDFKILARRHLLLIELVSEAIKCLIDESPCLLILTLCRQHLLHISLDLLLFGRMHLRLLCQLKPGLL